MLTYYLSFKGTPHCLRFLLSFICSWLNNKSLQEIVNNPGSLLLSMSAIFKKITARFLYFCFEKRLFPKYPKNVFNGNSSMYFENIAV